METIRLANADDVARCAELLGMLFSQEREFSPDLEAQSKGLAMIVNNPDAGFVLVYEDGGIIQGMVLILFTVSTALGKRVAILEDMIVTPDFRAKGVGTSLVERALELALDKGCGRVTLLTDHDNEAAHKIYRKCGFTKSDMVVFRMLIGS
ncbi:MAG TPA: GNAT family N-acetyltransferase [Syntrophorhabdales bacterium]|nr:GNAT family N-acetyltransferase [Syntrophorhabdales bacterium]